MKKLTPEALVLIVGEQRAIALCQKFPNQTIPDLEKILVRRRRAAALADYKQGWATEHVCAKYGLTTIQVLDMVRDDAKKQRKEKKLHKGIQLLIDSAS